MSMLALDAFRKAYNHSFPISKLLAKDAYVAYLIQTFPISLVGIIFVRLMTDSPLLNFVLTGIFTVPLTFVIVHYVRQLPGLQQII